MADRVFLYTTNQVHTEFRDGQVYVLAGENTAAAIAAAGAAEDAVTDAAAQVAAATSEADRAEIAADSAETLRNAFLLTIPRRDGFFRTPTAWNVGMSVPVRIGAVNGIVAAFAKRDGTFKAGWRDGNNLKHIDTVDGSLWESVSLAKMKDPDANGISLTEVYHHYATGNNANPGTIGSQKQTFDAALAVAGDVHIRPSSNMVGSTSMARNWAVNKNVKITGSRVDGKPTFIADMRDAHVPTWTDLGDGVFKNNFSVNAATKTGPILANIRTPDSEGRPIIYRYDSATYASDALRKAALLALAPNTGEGAWLLDMTAGVNTEGQYVKTADGLAPVFGASASHIYSESTNQARWEPYAAKLIYCENLHFIYNAKTADQPSIYFRTQGITPGGNVEYTGELGLYNVAFSFSGKQGIRTDDLKRYSIDRFVSYANHEDSINPHTFNTQAGPLLGSYMYHTYSNGICNAVGNFGWRDQATLSRSGNAFTSHDAINSTCFNLVGGNTFGAVCAVVGGSKTWMVNCHFHTPTNPDGEGPIVGNLSNPGSPNAVYWADGAGTDLWLSMCSGNGGSETFAATNGGKIYIDNFLGNWTGRVAGGGQILDFDGTVLMS